MSLMFKIILGAVIVYLGIGAAMYFGQRRLMYHPDVRHLQPADAGLSNVQERLLDTGDGNKVVVWYAKAAPGQPTILYFHGNGGGLAARADCFQEYAGRGRGLFMMAYRGFAGSTGYPTEKANIADAKLAYDALRAEGVAAEDIILYGESLGTGVAVQVAADKKAGGLILDAPYTSIADVAAGRYPWLPVHALVTDSYNTMAYVSRVTAPSLVIHGEKDDVVPIAMGRAVFAALHEPKFIATFPEAYHDDHADYGSYGIINAWIDRLRSGKAPDPY